ncbi:N-acetyltransferase [Treponema sp. HNW]|uniref:GNAT family N-acetyltransferase n=1 Tax=Treponema sp. HNW TaxID=3116654 RepID=UPI003D13525B
MYIRKTEAADIPAVLSIYKNARSFMRRNGNGTQWSEDYPGEVSLRADMEKKCSYVCCTDKSEVCASFYFAREIEPSYAFIRGAWLNDEPYGLVHRIACCESGRGIGSFCLQYCLSEAENIRIDTHKDNLPMRSLLKKLNFVYCGIVLLSDGSERLAFQKRLFKKAVTS